MFFEQFEILCKKNNTTPTEFTTKILKLSSSKVTAWKNGSIPKYGILESIAKHFGVSIGYLFDGEIKKDVVSEIENNDTKRLIEIYDQLTDDAQKELLNYAEYMTTKESNLRKTDEIKSAV